MRMYLYYAVHSFINQVKKLFKTWVLIFFAVCFIVGIGLGAVIGLVANKAEAEKEEQVVEENYEPEEAAEPGTFSIIKDEIGVPAMTELVCGAIILILFVLTVVNADKSAGRIFLPADVGLLFPSPLKPQSVLLFRIGMQAGTMIFMFVYMLLQLPNLVGNLGLSIWAALAIILAFSTTIFFASLLQLLMYLLCSMSATFKRLMRPGITVIFALAAAGFLTYRKNTGLDYPLAAAGFFNSTAARCIPIWGWTKGFVRAAVDGDLSGALIFLGLLIFGMLALIYIIWSLKVDFYEDAMARSEEVAALMEAAKSNRSGVAVAKKKKDRSDSLERDGMKYGHGASVFFFKNMYNRFRFAHLHFFTKTMEFYFAVAVAVGLVCRFYAETDNVLWLVGVFTALTFFRSLGNPLEDDTRMAYFIMIPESTWLKMFYSLISGVANTALDLIPPVIAGAIIMGANPFVALAWILGMLTVYFYSVSVGTFIGLSLPEHAGQQLKQLVQVMFVYFGLLPDAIVIAVGYALGNIYIGVFLALVCNIGLGLAFFSFASLFLKPKGGTGVTAV